MTTPEYAGFWRRVLASSVDVMWSGAVLLGISLLFYHYSQELPTQLLPGTEIEWTEINWAEINWTEINWRAILLNDVLPTLVILFFWLRYAATPGKLLCDCKIVDANTGRPITVTQAIIRYIGYFPSFLLFGLGFISITWNKRKQGWHDRMAGTAVIIYDESACSLPQLMRESC